jgi:uncharacterized protein YbjT (DUF2867 family)
MGGKNFKYNGMVMRVQIFGATGMVGRGVLRECLLDPDVAAVLTLGRATTGEQNGKLREIAHANLFDLAPIESELGGFDACFFCLGVSAVGMKEAEYRRITFDLTLAVANTLARLNPAMTFIYVSGKGTGNYGIMWSRVKRETELALAGLPFRAAYAFRPGAIVPLHGIRSKTGWYQVVYDVLSPVLPALQRAAPRFVTTTELVGRAMLRVAKSGWPTPELENPDINRAGSLS